MNKGDLNPSMPPEHGDEAGSSSNVLIACYLHKVDSKRQKWFVLRRDENLLWLDYYRRQPNSKKVHPKKTINISEAFAIQRKPDNNKQASNLKKTYTLYIYTLDDTIGLIFNDENQFKQWYDILVEAYNSYFNTLKTRLGNNENLPKYRPAPDYNWVWEVRVTVVPPEKSSLLKDGTYRLVLSASKMVYFHRKSDPGSSPNSPIELHLQSVKKIAHGDNRFHLETGRSSVVGPCDVWMQTEDKATALHIHETFRKSMTLAQSGQSQTQQSQPPPIPILPAGDCLAPGGDAYLNMEPAVSHKEVHSGPTLPQETQLISALASQHLSSNSIIQSPSLVNKSSILLELGSSGYVSMAPSSGNTDSPSELLMSPTSSAPSNGPLDSSEPSGYLNMVPTTYLTELPPVKPFLPSETSSSTLTSVHGNAVSFSSIGENVPSLARANMVNLPPNASAASTTSSTSNIASSNSSFMSLAFSSGNQSMAAASSDHQSSLRQLRSYSYGSRPLSQKGSRSQMRPTRSSILASLFVGDSLSMSESTPAETSIRSRAHSTGSHGMKDIKSSIHAGVTNNFRIDSDLKEEVAETSASQSSLDENKKCTKSSSVPFLNQPTMRERSSTVGSRPGKKSK